MLSHYSHSGDGIMAIDLDKIQAIYEDQGALERELEGSSDRAAVIVAAAFIDNLLENALLSAFVGASKAENANIFSGHGPLGTFSGKIEICYRVGIISKYEKTLIHKIRQIRNKFAHELRIDSLNSKKVKTLVAELSIPIELIFPNFIPIEGKDGQEPPLPLIEKADTKDLRAIFRETIAYLVFVLQIRAVQTKFDEMKPFESAVGPAEYLASEWKDGRKKIEELEAKVAKLEKEAEEKQKSAGEEVADKKGAKNENEPFDADRYTGLFEINDFCIEQVKKAHETKNYKS